MNAAEYLGIPTSYSPETRGLTWSRRGDAIETGGGQTFALAEEVRAFLDGFASRKPLIHFAHVLHFIGLLKRGPSIHDFYGLGWAWREAGRPAGTAGAFAAHLCEMVPSLASPVSPAEVASALTLRGLDDDALNPGGPEDPPFTPADFEALLAAELKRYTPAEIAHWMRHGQPPAGDPEQLAREVVAAWPPSLGEVLEEVSRHERISGAVPLVGRLVGALALPPRRLADRHLPLGGYSDVGTRGRPEQILPGQFALDELEFLRRHAEHELLYYRREEPHSPTRDRLVVLLDQGVRTWGRVRLLLAGCLLALSEIARRRKMALAIAATSNAGEAIDPLAAVPGELAELVAASDLTAHPGLALERVLEGQDGACDVVMLTHPRSLDEADVQAAARRAAGDVRLFAVAVAASGEVTFNELRRGLPVRLSRFHADLDIPAPAPLSSPTGEWRGDLEPVGFPFRFGPGGNHDPFHFAFDHDGDYLLAALSHGLLSLMKRDGSAHELLPRVLLDGQLLNDPHGVLGVAGGFVVTAALPGRVVAAHYDLASRQVRTCTFAATGAQLTRGLEWRYCRRRHAVAVRMADQYEWLNLATGQRVELPAHLRWEPPRHPSRLAVPLSPQDDDWPLERAATWPRPVLRFDARHGTLDLAEVTPAWQPFTPTSDGRSGLIGRTLIRAECRRHALAVLFMTPERAKELWLFAGPEGRTLTTLLMPFERDAFALSADGRYLALQRGASQVEVRETAAGGGAVGQSPVGRFHNNVAVELGERWLAVSIDQRVHLFGWHSGGFYHTTSHPSSIPAMLDYWEEKDRPGGPGQRAVASQVPGFLSYDRARFRLAAWQNLIAVVTLFGEVFVFEHGGELVCGFFTFRQQAAAWMPDGTRWGAESLLVGPPTPGAAERIGKALADAWERGERTVV